MMKGFLRHTLASLCLSIFCLTVNAGQNTDGESFTIPDGIYSAKFIEDRDNVSIVEFIGDYNRSGVDGSSNVAARAVIAQEFYKHHVDQYDFLVIFSSFEYDTGDARAFYSSVANDTEGLGLELFDNSALFGSEGELEGVIDMGAITRYELSPLTALSSNQPDSYNEVLSTLAHETLHRWGAYSKLPGVKGRDEAHWSFFLDTDGSVEYGNDWQDNGDGTFTAGPASRSFYSPLDLYLMGMRSPELVPDTFFIQPQTDEYAATDLPLPGATITGTKQAFGVQDLISEHGNRVPAATDAQKEFRYAFIYLTTSGEPPSSLELSQLNQASQAYAQRFAIMTGGVGVANIYPQVSQASDAGTYGTVGDDSQVNTSDLDISAAIAWLEAQQKEDGSWLDKDSTVVRDTALVIQTLENEPGYSGNANLDGSKSWLREQPTQNHDSAARAMSAVRAGRNQLLELFQTHNDDGGWGLTVQYESNPLDTALVINGLNVMKQGLFEDLFNHLWANYLESGINLKNAQGRISNSTFGSIQKRFDDAVVYLSSAQNGDGSWGSTDSGVGSIVATAQILLTLKELNPDVLPVVERAINWLVLQKNSDGGFGVYQSSSHETAIALTALVKWGVINRIDPLSSIQYLVDRQYSSGSWEGSVYTTSLVLQAMRSVSLPNLTVSEISSVDGLLINDGARIKLSVDVVNDSEIPVGASVLRFYQGDPDNAGIEFLAVNVPELDALTKVTVRGNWDSLGYQGDISLYAVADSDATILERSESDNTASINVSVEPAPAGVELEVTDAEFLVQPNSPNSLPSPLAISAVIRNNGQTAAENVVVELWQDARDQQAGGILVESQTVSLTSRSSLGANFSAVLDSPGTTQFILVVDADQTFSELNEQNNIAYADVTTIDSIDLAVESASVVQSPGQLFSDSNAEFQFEIANTGTVSATNASLQVSIVNDSGETELLSTVFLLEAGERKFITAQWLVDYVGQSNLIIELDADDLIAEADETNNSVSIPITSDQRMGINLKSNFQDLAINPNPGLEGLGASISTLVRNTGSEPIETAQVTFYDGEPGLNKVIGSTLITNISPNTAKQAEIIWPEINGAGTRFIYVVLDPSNLLDEINESDNTAFVRFDVASLADLAVSSTSIQATPAFPRVNEPLTLDINVANVGKQAAQGAEVLIYQGDPNSAESRLLHSQQINVDGVGDKIVSFQHQFLAEGTNSIFVVIDPSNQLLEMTKDNNRASRQFVIQDRDFYVTDQYLSPNDDGEKDSIDYGFNLPAVQSVSVVVINKYNEEIMELTLPIPVTASGVVSWNGKNKFGSVVADGQYQIAVKTENGSLIGSEQVIIDTNQSPLSEALNTEFALFENRSCDFGETQTILPYTDPSKNTVLAYGPLGQQIYFSTFYKPVKDADGNIESTGGLPNRRHTRFPTGIYRANIDGTEIQQLIGDSPTDGFDLVASALDEYRQGQLKTLVVSADGLRLLLELQNGFSTERELWTMSVAGGDLRKLTTVLGEIENISYIGTDIYFTHKPQNELRALWKAQDVPNSQLINLYELTETGRFFIDTAEVTFSKTASHSLIHGQPTSINSSNQNRIGQDLESDEFALSHLDLTTLLSSESLVNAYAWAPTQKMYAAANSRTGTIDIFSFDGNHISAIDIGELQRSQFSPEEWSHLQGYLVATSRLSERQFFAAIKNITWNPDSSEFAFSLSDRLPEFYFEDGCEDFYGTAVNCREIPANIRPLIERYQSLEGIFVANVEGSRITKVASGSNSTVNGPQDSGQINDYGLSISRENLPIITGIPSLQWLNGARELVVDFSSKSDAVLLDLDAPTIESRALLSGGFVRSKIAQRPPGKRLSYQGYKYTKEVPENFNNLPRPSEFCGLRNDHIQLRSLLNLEADLRVRRAGRYSGAVLEGSAADKNFAEYRIEYQDADTGNAWTLVMPPSQTRAIDQSFTTWVPPYIGRFHVRLTVTDKAGNKREKIKLYNNNELASISGIQLSAQDFSPNGDGVLETTSLSFKVLESVNVVVDIYNDIDIPVRRYIESFDLVGSQQQITWDGRDENGTILPDGTYRLVIQGFEYFVDLDNTKPTLKDFTPPLFRSVQPSALPDTCRDFSEGEVIQEDDYSLLVACVVSTISSVVADADDSSGLVEVRLERKLQDSQVWEPISTDQSGLSRVTLIDDYQKLQDLFIYSYRIVARDSAGNTSELALRDRRNLVHIMHERPGELDIRPYDFLYMQHDDYGVVTSPRQAGTIRMSLNQETGEGLHQIRFDHTLGELASLTILFREKDGSDMAYQAQSLPFKTVPENLESLFDLGKVLSSFDPSIITSTVGEYEARFRLIGVDGDTAFTDPFELQINESQAIVEFLDRLESSISEPFASHPSHYLSTVDSSYLGLHAAIRINLAKEQISEAYLEVQSIGSDQILSEYINKTRVFGSSSLEPDISFPNKTIFNIHDPAIILNGECGYRYRLTATFISQSGRRYTSSVEAEGNCIQLSAMVSPDQSTICDNIPTNRLKVRLDFGPFSLQSLRPEIPLTLILGSARLNSDGSEGFGEVYSVENFPSAFQKYRTYIDTQDLSEGEHQLRAELIYEDGFRVVSNFSAPIVHAPPTVDVSYPTQGTSICPSGYVKGVIDFNEPDFVLPPVTKAIQIQGEISSEGPSFLTSTPRNVEVSPVDTQTNPDWTFTDIVAPQNRLATMYDTFFYDSDSSSPATGLGNNPVVLEPVMTRVSDHQEVRIQNARFSPISGKAIKQGVIAFAAFNDEDEEQTLELHVSNWSGARLCKTIDVDVDAKVKDLTFALDGGRVIEAINFQRIHRFSPKNQDGNYDDIEIAYSIGEPVKASLSIFSLPQCDELNACELKDTDPLEEDRVAYLLNDVDIDLGSENIAWNGQNEAGEYVEDGEYLAQITVIDDCGNKDTLGRIFAIDNTPPENTIEYPFDGASLPTQVSVLGSVKDELYMQSYILSVIDRTQSEAKTIIFKTDMDEQQKTLFAKPYFLNFAGDSAARTGVLGTWDTSTLLGERFIELESEDALGNKASIEVPIVIPERKTLINSHDTVNFFVSPNADTRLDELAVRTGFNVDVNATYEILDFSNRAVVSTFVTDRSSSAGYNIVKWNGELDSGAVAADGFYYVRVTATALGQIESAEVIFELDTTPPSIDVASLAGGYIQLKQGREILGNISDKNFEDSGISLVSSPLDIDNPNQIDRPLIVAQSDDESFGILTSLPETLFNNEAIYDVSFAASDKAGNRALQVWPMLIDLYPPEIVISSPEPLSHFNLAASPVSLLGSVTDSNLKSYQVNLTSANDPSNPSLIHQSNIKATEQIAPWDLNGLDDGIYTLKVDADDLSGRTATKSIKLVIDNTPPEVQLTSPELNEYLTSVQPAFGTAADLNLERYTLSVAAGQVDESANYSELFTSDRSVRDGVLYNPTQLPNDGVYTYRLFGEDVAGNTSVTYQHFNVDTVPPGPPTLESVEYDKTTDEVTITWLALETPDLVGYNLYRNNIKVNDAVIPDLSLIEQGLAEGTYRYYVKAVDRAGLESEESNALSSTIDITPPLASIGSPADSARVNLLVDISGTAFSDNDFKEYRLYIGTDQAQLALVKTSSLPVKAGELFQWSTLGLVDGQDYFIRLEAEDIRENIASDEIQVTIDNLAPDAPINLSSAVSNGNDIGLIWEHPIPSDDLLGYLLYRNGRLVNASGPVIGELNQYAIEEKLYDDLSLADGDYEYQVIAIDMSGNVSLPSNVVTEKIDLRPPHAFFVNVSDGDEFEDSLFIIADSEDIDIANIEISFRPEGETDWQSLVVDSSDPYELVWETQNIPYGAYELRALATDNTANIDPSPQLISVIKKDLVIPKTLIDLEVAVVANEGFLSWPESSDNDVVGYHVYRRCEQCTQPVKITNGSLVDVNSFVDTVQDSIIYYYGVSAVDGADNESVLSDQLKAVYFDTFLSVDRYLTLADTVISEVDFSSVMLRQFGSNTAEVPVDAGKLMISTDGTATREIPLTISDQRPIQSMPTLLMGENTIVGTVSAEAGQFIAQTSEALKVIKSEKPSAPTNFTAVSSTSEPEVALSWDANPINQLVVGYRVLRDEVTINQLSLIEDSTAQTNNGDDPAAILPASPVNDFWTASGTESSIGQSWSDSRLVSRIELDWSQYQRRAKTLNIYALIDGEYVRVRDTIVGSDDNGFVDVIELTPPIPTTSINIRVRDWLSSFGRLSQMRIFASDFQSINTSFQDQPGDGTYRYAVTAINQYGFESDRSEAVNDTVVGDVDPPEEVVLAINAVGTTANLSWNAVIDAATYKVYRDGTFIAEVVTLEYPDSGLANGVYTYTVTALDVAENESGPSNQVEALINIPLLTSPVNLAAHGSLERAENTLIWEHLSDLTASSFNIYRSLLSGANFELLASANELSYIDTAIELDVVYYYYVVAVDSLANESAQSNEANALSADQTAPVVPVITTPTRAGVDYLASDDLETIGGFAEPGSLVYLLQQGTFALEPVPASTQTELSNLGLQELLSVAPDGRIVTMPDRYGEFYLFDTEQTEIIDELSSLVGNYVSSFIWTAEGDLLIKQADDLHLFDFATKQLTKLALGSINRQILDIHAYSSLANTFIASARIDGGSSEVYRFDLGSFDAQQMPQNFNYRVSSDTQYFVYTSFVNGAGTMVTVFDTQSLTSNEFLLTNAQGFNGSDQGSTFSADNKYIKLLTYSDSNSLQTQIFERATGELIDTISVYNSEWVTQEIVSYLEHKTESGDYDVVQRNVASQNSEVIGTISGSNVALSALRAYSRSGLPIVVDQNFGKIYHLVKLAGWYQFDDRQLENGANVFSVIAVDEARNQSLASLAITVLYQRQAMIDLAVELAPDPANPVFGRDVNLKIDVSNLGDLDAPQSLLSVKAFDVNGTETVIFEQTIGSLLAADSSQLDIAWRPSSVGVFNIVAAVDADKQIEELSEANNVRIASIEVHATADPFAFIVLHASASGNNQFTNNVTASGLASITNPGLSFDGTIVIEIVDLQGAVVEELSRTTIFDLSFSEELELPYTWYTGLVFAGEYKARVSLFDTLDVLVSQAETSLSIKDLLKMVLGVSSNALTYTSNQNALLNSIVVNNSLSSIYAGGELVTEVVSSGGAVVFRDVKVMGELTARDRLSQLAVWNVGGNVSGEYLVNAKLYLESEVIAQATTRIDVVSTLGAMVAGKLELENMRLIKPAMLAVDYELSNSGSIDLIQTVIELQLFDENDLLINTIERTIDDFPIGGSAQFSASFGTIDLVVGSYQVKMLARFRNELDVDVEQLIDTKSLELIEANPPMVAITSPTLNQILNTLRVIGRYSVSDDTEVASVEVRFDTSNWVPQTITPDGQYTADLSVLNDGQHVLQVRSQDIYTNLGAQTISFIVDNTPPSIEVVNVDQGQLFTSAITPSVSVVELHPDTQSMTLNGASYILGTPISSGGSYELVVTATDLAGNSTTFQRNFEIEESNPPVIEITSPTLNQILNSNKVLGQYSVSDDTQVTSVEVRFDANNWIPQTITPDGQYSADLSALNDGQHVIEIRAQDIYTNLVTQSISFIVDNTPPAIEVVNIDEGQVFNAAITPIVSIVDLHPDTQSITLNGVSYILGTAISSGGAYQLVMTATDAAGNTSSLRRSFNVEGEEPPVAEVFSVNDDSFSTQRGVWGTVRVLENDQIPSKLHATVRIVDQPLHGQIVVASEGVYNFFPITRYLGQDEFTYEVSLSDGRSKTARVLVDVFPGLSCSMVNDHSTSTDQPVTLPGWARTANDQITPPRYRIEIVSVSDPEAFTGAGLPKVTYPNCDLSYQPKAGAQTKVTVTYKVVDAATNGAGYTSRLKTFELELALPLSGMTVIVPILDLILSEE